MDRRSFLTTSAWLGSALAAGSVLAATTGHVFACEEFVS